MYVLGFPTIDDKFVKFVVNVPSAFVALVISFEIFVLFVLSLATNCDIWLFMPVCIVISLVISLFKLVVSYTSAAVALVISFAKLVVNVPSAAVALVISFAKLVTSVLTFKISPVAGLTICIFASQYV